MTMTKSQTEFHESELARHCAYSLPGVALTLGRQNWKCLKAIYGVSITNFKPIKTRIFKNSEPGTKCPMESPTNTCFLNPRNCPYTRWKNGLRRACWHFQWLLKCTYLILSASYPTLTMTFLIRLKTFESTEILRILTKCGLVYWKIFPFFYQW